MSGINLTKLKQGAATAPVESVPWYRSAKEAAEAIVAINGVLGGTGKSVDAERVMLEIGVPLRDGETATTRREVFAYDIELGVVTLNEARAAKGLPPVDGGDSYYVPPDKPAT
jgi:hypothetical protein